MDFRNMTLTQLVVEMNNFRNQLTNQSFPITAAQRRRWQALTIQYKRTSAELAK